MFWFKKNKYKSIIDSLTLDVSRLEEEKERIIERKRNYYQELTEEIFELKKTIITLEKENVILRNKVLEKLGGEDDTERKETI